MRAIPTLKIGISGVRGVIGDSLTPVMLVRFAQAFGTYIGAGTVVIGRDPRTSGEMVKQAVIAGLLSSGVRVIDIGMCPVPTIQLLVRQHQAQGGIAVTASHNPPEWNALKFIGPAGLFLGAGQAREMLDIYHQGDYTKMRATEIRTIEEVSGATDLHIKAILDTLGPVPKAKRPLRVVLDSCNGAGSVVGPKLLEALGVEVISINVTPNGSFPRGAEPLPENLGDLCAAVKKHHADIGFAQDMDADRLAIVSEQGSPIGEDYTLVLATAYVLGKEQGPVVANLSSTTALNAVIGGEGNGGVIYPRINYARDSLVGMALILHLIAQKGKKVTELLNLFPHYTILKEKLACPSYKLPVVLKALRQDYESYPIDLRDGIKVVLPNGWFLVRGSNTEPIIRVTAEAKAEREVREIVARVYARVKACIDTNGNSEPK